ncbi:19770_t:CDS:2 [Funneliformis geosporum]|nr:19770_t:CDS:2 [Funneliformis geosporum]
MNFVNPTPFKWISAGRASSLRMLITELSEIIGFEVCSVTEETVEISYSTRNSSNTASMSADQHRNNRNTRIQKAIAAIK